MAPPTQRTLPTRGNIVTVLSTTAQIVVSRSNDRSENCQGRLSDAGLRASSLSCCLLGSPALPDPGKTQSMIQSKAAMAPPGRRRPPTRHAAVRTNDPADRAKSGKVVTRLSNTTQIMVSTQRDRSENCHGRLSEAELLAVPPFSGACSVLLTTYV
jgi:hypothetical protein